VAAVEPRRGEPDAVTRDEWRHRVVAEINPDDDVAWALIHVRERYDLFPARGWLDDLRSSFLCNAIPGRRGFELSRRRRVHEASRSGGARLAGLASLVPTGGGG
jgi:hypothetical protein